MLGDDEQLALDASARAGRPDSGRSIASSRLAARMLEQLTALREPDAAVELVTVHGAKGREWPTVVVLGFEEERFPNRRALLGRRRPAARGRGGAPARLRGANPRRPGALSWPSTPRGLRDSSRRWDYSPTSGATAAVGTIAHVLVESRPTSRTGQEHPGDRAGKGLVLHPLADVRRLDVGQELEGA